MAKLVNPRRALMAYRFLVQPEGSNLRPFAAARLTGLTWSSTPYVIEECTELGAARQFPGLRKFSDVTMERGVFLDSDYVPTTQIAADVENTRCNMLISVISGDRLNGDPVFVPFCRLWACGVKSLGSPGFDARNSALLFKQIILHVDAITFNTRLFDPTTVMVSAQRWTDKPVWDWLPLRTFSQREQPPAGTGLDLKPTGERIPEEPAGGVGLPSSPALAALREASQTLVDILR